MATKIRVNTLPLAIVFVIRLALFTLVNSPILLYSPKALTATEESTEDRSIVFGHNLTPTTETLKKNAWTFGNYVLGWGATDHLTIATSPWLISSYNMYNLIGRARGCAWKATSPDANSCEVDWGAQLMYFKTGRFFSNSYQMEAASGSFLLKKDLSPSYTVDLALNYMYFFDETSPFSLRREPYNDNAYQWSLSTLQTVRLPYGLGINIELGCLGLNYVYPEWHIGASFFHKSKYSLVQIGYSQTFTFGTLSHMFRVNQNGTLGENERGYDFSMHPEIQLQFFF